MVDKMLSIEVISLIPVRKTVHLGNVDPDATLSEIIEYTCKKHEEICKYYDEQILLILHGNSSIIIQRDEIKNMKLRDVVGNNIIKDEVIKIYITPVLEGG